jgi:hypothetical protein
MGSDLADDAPILASGSQWKTSRIGLFKDVARHR